MAKKVSTRSAPKKTKETPIQNSLSDALGLGMGPMGQLETPMISQVATLFKNERWYLASNMRQLLSEMYVEHGLIQTLVDVPVEDAFRGGIDINTSQLDEDEIKQLKLRIDELRLLTTYVQTKKWNRLFGGAGVLIITNQNPQTPFDVSTLRQGDKVEFRDCDMWELFWNLQNTENTSPYPDAFNIGMFNYYGIQIDASRVKLMRGIKAPSFIRPRLRGWGLSVVEAVVRSINQYLKSTSLTFEVLDEFKVDIFKIKGLTNSLANQNGVSAIQKRVALANMQKNYQHAMAMDSEDDWQQKQLSFAGLSETMEGIRMQIASDLRMPLTKLFGISAQGFSSGQDDIENYNAMVESSIRTPAKYDLLDLVGIVCQTEFGFVPDDLDISFKPLRVLSAEQEESVKTQKFTRVTSALTAGIITPEEARDMLNKDNLLPLQLKENATLPEIEDADTTNTASKGGGASGSKSKTAAKEAPEAKE